MPLSSSTRFVVPPHPEVPDATRERAERRLRALETRRSADAEARGQRAGRILKAGLRALRETVGEPKLRKLREFTRRQAEEIRESLRPPGGIGGSRALVRAAALREREAFLRKTRIDADAIHRIEERLDGQLAGIERPHLRKAGGPPFTGLDPDFFQKFREAMRHRWITFAPPYQGAYTLIDIYLSQSKFHEDAANRGDPAIGQVGMDVHVDMTDVGDVDMCFSDVETGIAFWWKAPATGIPEVVIEAVNARSRHVVVQGSEWGSSSWKLSLQHDLEVFGTHPNLALTHYSTLYKEFLQGVDTVSSTWDSLEAGVTYVASFVLDGVVAAGDWVLIQAGAYQHDSARLNDVTTVWDSQYRWLFKTVRVRVRP